MQVTAYGEYRKTLLAGSKIVGRAEHPLADSVAEEFRDVYQAAKPMNLRPPRITRDDIPGHLEYRAAEKNATRTLISKQSHNGQAKLVLTEIQHLTESLEDMNEVAYVIYAGSAPSMKIMLLSGMFPGVIFIMIDPNEHLFRVKGGNHYSKPDHNLVRYMSVSATNSYYDAQSPTKTVLHYREGLVNKLTLREDIPASFADGQNAEGVSASDVAEYIIRESSRDAPEHKASFFIFEEYMTEQLADALRPLMETGKKVILWSDIRAKHSVEDQQAERQTRNIPGSLHFDPSKKIDKIRPTGTDQEEYPDDIDVISGGAMFYIWARALARGHESKLMGMFKFRVPYCNDPVDWTQYPEIIERAKELGADYRASVDKKEFLMFPGKIYLQAWAGVTSAESRLHFHGVDELVGYSITEHEEKLFYYNVIERFTCRFENPYANKSIGFDTCGDCAITAKVLGRYKDINPEADIHTMITSLCQVTHLNLLRQGGYHGRAY